VDADFGVALGHRGSYRYAAHDGDLGLELLGDAEASDDDLGEMIPARADAVADRLGVDECFPQRVVGGDVGLLRAGAHREADALHVRSGLRKGSRSAPCAQRPRSARAHKTGRLR
jgi:hypothetical protein